MDLTELGSAEDDDGSEMQLEAWVYHRSLEDARLGKVWGDEGSCFR